MTRVTLDTNTTHRLLEFMQPVEVCDEQGRVVGRFIPRADLNDWEPVSGGVSEDELDRREQETDSLTTSEVLAHLKGLECSESDGSVPQ
ncbi:MAG: hypothetical protein CMJ64_19315 [Planctomycetaceae bacterium]|nr:hypothetical protein [Planctomycetaceae bacterium]